MNYFISKTDYIQSLDCDKNLWLKKHKPEDALYTATLMSVISLKLGIKLLNENIKTLILTGGGRKNKFLIKNII